MPTAEPGSSEPTLARRAVSIALTIAVHLLLLVMLLRVAPHIAEMANAPTGPLIVTLNPDTGEQAAASAKPQPERKASKPAAAEKAPATPPVPPEEPVPPVPTPLPPELIYMTRADMMAGDISRLPTASAAAAPASGSAEKGNDDAPLGKGPQGQRLYAASWYREPTDQELSFYLSRTRANVEGWGTIACRTVARYHVEDCVALGESPRGSGLSQAVLNAAWQFLVRPPRIDGRELVGEWVSIRIDYTNSGAKAKR